MIEHMNEPQIREQLTISQQQGTLVEVYNFADDDTFNVGFVIAMDPLFVLLIDFGLGLQDQWLDAGPH